MTFQKLPAGFRGVSGRVFEGLSEFLGVSRCFSGFVEFPVNFREIYVGQ